MNLLVCYFFVRLSRTTTDIFILLHPGLFMSWTYYFILKNFRTELFLKMNLVWYFFVVIFLACGTANISWGSVLAMRYLITFYSFSGIYILLILFLYSILSILFPCTLCGRTHSFSLFLFRVLFFLDCCTSVGGTVARGWLVLEWV